MSRTKRMIASLLMLAMLLPQFTSLSTYASASSSQTKQAITGELTVSVVFDECNLYEDVTNRDVNVVLKNNGTVVYDVNVSNDVARVSNSTYSIKEITEGNQLQAYQITFSDLAQSANYSVEFSGNGHVDFSVPKVDITDYSKSLVVSSSDNTFTYGDINGDKKIDAADLEILKAQLTDNTAGTSADLNGDGIVNVADLAVLTAAQNDQKMGAPDYNSIMSNTVRLTSFADNVDITEIEENVTILDGNIADIFDPTTEEAVKIEMTGDSELIIPIALDEPTPMSVIEIQTPTIDGTITNGSVMVTIIDDDGEESEIIVPFGAASVATMSVMDTSEGIFFQEETTISDVPVSSNVIVIDLGTRVVVKKISVVVEQADNDDGYVVIQNVTFIEEIVPENPFGSDGIIENLAAKNSDKKVTLTWNTAPNVGGYIVHYGTSPGSYSSTAKTSTNSIEVTMKDNYEKHYFSVQSFYDDWTGPMSSEVSGMGIPSVIPSAPNTISVTPEDRALIITWNAALNAETHNVYIKHEDETEYRLIANQTKSLSASVGSLENDETYDIKITGVNHLGEGPAGTAQGVPEKINQDGPNFSEYKRIPNSNIASASMAATYNVANIYPNGFSTKFTYDEDYSTYWQYSHFSWSSVFNYTFVEPKDMDYVVWVPNVTSDSYATTLGAYSVTVWLEGDNLNGSGRTLHNANYASTNPKVEIYTAENGIKYAVLPFEKQENVVKIAVGAYIVNGGRSPTTLAEIVFFEYDGVAEKINDLFANNIRTELKPTVTQADFDAIDAEMAKFEDHVLRDSIMNAELDLARTLFTADKSDDLTGYVKEDFVSINTSNDSGAKLSNISPLGIVGYARYDILMYADIPEGETLTIYPSQVFMLGNFKGTGIELKNGRNIINVEDLTNVYGAIEGGSFYYTYTGNNAEDIKLHMYKEIGTFQGVDYVTEVIKIPTLELYDLDLQDDETQVRQLITEYVEEFDAFMQLAPDAIDTNQNISYSQTLNPINTTEISLRGVLISQPASQVYAAIGGAAATTEAKVNKLYNNALAWEEINYITNRVYGDTIVDGVSTRQGRQNVRYMRMSGSAFMYAAGNHIGTQYGSAGTTVSGTPTSVTGAGNQNNLFGWGIAHEIGHNLDRLGVLEVTNNIYSQLVVNYTGEGNQAILSSRIPFNDVFSKVSATGYGASSNVFVELGKYWQLQLAYADESDMLAYYDAIFSAYNSGSSYSGNNKFEVLASLAAGKDLTDFFAAWGTTLSTQAKSAISHLPKETRAIWYMDDSSRAYSLNGGSGMSAGQMFNVTATAVDSKVTIQNDLTITDDLQGFIVYRNGQSIAFTKTNSYVDTVASTNNKVVNYSMQAVDKLGNIVSDKISAEQLRISYENLVDAGSYSISAVDGGVKVTFNNPTSISGLRIMNAPTSGAITANLISVDEDGNEINNSTVLNTDFSNNDSGEDGKYISYFVKAGADFNDTRIGTYDAKELTITGVSTSDDIAIISYVGDSVEFTDYVMGKLGHDFDTGDGILKAGDVIIVGNYIGDPYFNEITINGEFVTSTLTDTGYEITTTERPFSGDTYMFATVPEGGVVSTITDGLFIFKPNLQAESDFQSFDLTACSHETLFPNRVQAVMTRNDSQGNGRETANTLWEYTATFDTMPTIVLESDFDVETEEDELIGPPVLEETEQDDVLAENEDETDLEENAQAEGTESDDVVSDEESSDENNEEVNAEEECDPEDELVGPIMQA